MGEPITLSRGDWFVILRIAVLVLAAIVSGGLLAWMISGRPIALLLGSVVFAVAVVWTHERLKLSGKQSLATGWLASGAVGIAARVVPGPLAALVCLAAMTGAVVESRLNHRRIRAGVASRAAKQQRPRQQSG